MRKHIKALDGVRGIAIAMVLLIHFFANFTPTNMFEKILVTIAGRGNLGVDLFFVLSGFLITGILLASKGTDPHYFKNFYMRRTLRIFPLYYGVLVVIFLILPCFALFKGPTLALMQSQEIWAWTYSINFLVAQEGIWTPPYISHFWSLAVEEHFYFIWPLAVYFLSSRNLLRLSIGFILFSVALSLLLTNLGVNQLAVYTLTPCRLGGLCLGAILAIYMPQLTLRHALQLLAMAIGGKLLILGVDGAWPATHASLEAFRTLTWTMVFGSLVITAYCTDEASAIGRGLTIKPLVFLGKYSYGLYVFHHFLSWGSEQNQGLERLSSFVPNHSLAVLIHGTLGIVLSIALAYLSFHGFEKHFLKLKSRYGS